MGLVRGGLITVEYRASLLLSVLSSDLCLLCVGGGRRVLADRSTVAYISSREVVCEGVGSVRGVGGGCRGITGSESVLDGIGGGLRRS